MQGLRKVLGRGSLVACGALFFGLSQCGGTKFNAGSGSAGSPPTEGGTTADAGAGGSALAGTAGGGGAGESTGGANEAGAAGEDGKGGGTVATCDCAAGTYCLEGSTDCLPCSDLGRLSFGEPVRLATVSDGGGGSRFPRIGITRTDLVYRMNEVGLRYTEDASTSAGRDVTATEPQDSSPLLLREPLSGFAIEGLSRLDFSFDRTVAGLATLRFATWADGLRSSVLAPAPLNSGAGDFSLAIALEATPQSARAFWMTRRDGASPNARKPRLVTARLGADTTATDVELKLSVGDDQECPLPDVSQPLPGAEPSDSDLTPWVTPDGTLLLFSMPRVEPGCAAGTQKKDIYTVLLQAGTGQPPAAALPMKEVNSPQDDLDPSFSADLCDLYFASNRDGKLAVYRAHRH